MIAFAQQDEERQILAANLRRLMAHHGLSLAALVEETGVDERTIRGVLRGLNKPHARTIHKLARGMGVDVDELLVDERAAKVSFDWQTNPRVREFIVRRPDLFEGWSTADFDDLVSRFGVGGELTDEGIEQAAQRINRRRAIIAKASLVLESHSGDRFEQLVEELYASTLTRE